MKRLIVLGVLLALGLLGVPLPVSAASDYGALAYTGSNPIGGGPGYVSPYGFSRETADYVVTTLSELQNALQSAGAGKVIWIPEGVVIKSPSTIGTLRAGTVLASCRGERAAGRLQMTQITTGSMTPLLWCQSNSKVSGLTIQGPGGYAGTSKLIKTNQGLRGTLGAVGIEIENCEIYDFALMAIYFYGGKVKLGSPEQHWIHHCYIHNCQRHGFGYGVCEEGGCSYLVECCVFKENRHHIMAQASLASGFPNSYELRYNYFYDSVYGFMGDPGNMYWSHQVDCHGGGCVSSTYAGGTLLVHHNTFTANSFKAHVAIRGIPKDCCKVYNNWSMKTSKSGAGGEPYLNGYYSLFSSNGGSWGGGSVLSDYGMEVENNWYGKEEPQGGAGVIYTPPEREPVSVGAMGVMRSMGLMGMGEEGGDEEPRQAEGEEDEYELLTFLEIEEQIPELMNLVKIMPIVMVGVGMICIVGVVATNASGVTIILAGVGTLVLVAGVASVMKILGG